MKDDDDQRFFKMAETYDKMAQLLVPKYDLLQDKTLKRSFSELEERKC
ncbi:MAG: hypothetical protein SVY15_02380 [Halobacteriota archaeon]|nr:hypothetical protein [Halobacteriota archaeon]